MKVNASKTKNFEEVKPGTYTGTFIRINDLGTQEGSYEGEPKIQHRIFVQWELNELMSDGRPFVVGAWVTVSNHEKATLRKWRKALRGSDFTDQEIQEEIKNGINLKYLMGAPCLVVVGLTKTNKTKVDSIAALPSGVTSPKVVNEMLFTDLENYSQEDHDKISPGIKRQVESSPEWRHVTRLSVEQGAPAGEEDIPF